MDFTYKGFYQGFKQGIPIAIGVASYGMVFGMLSKQAGLSVFQSFLMSSTVFAGASQLVAMDIWISPLPVFTIWITTLVINLRHLLMGATLHSFFETLSKRQAYFSLFFLTDENWAYSVQAWKNGSRNGTLLLGTGMALFISWVLSTVIGGFIGNIFSDPAKWGLDFAFTAIFICLACGMWRGKSDLLPWVGAALVSVLVYHFFPGKWYILAGSLSGSLIGVVTHGK